MANEAILNQGTELTLAATGTTSSISNGAVQECTDDNRQPSDNAGYVLGLFEFDTASTGFSAAPTANAVIKIYEQKINSNAADAPDVATTFLYDLIGTLPVQPSDVQQYYSGIFPIHPNGGKYWVQWVDGGSGTASVDAGWTLRMTPCAFGT